MQMAGIRTGAWWLAAGLLVSAPLAGQEPESARGGVMVAPRAGWMLALGALGRVADSPTAAVTSSSRWVSLSSGPMVGTSVVFDVPGLPLLWRMDVDHAPALAVRVAGEPVPYKAGSTYATAGIATRTGDARLEPFAQLGLGLRALQFRQGSGGVTEDTPVMPEGRVDLLGRFGGGLALRLGPMSLTAELAALTSTFRFPEDDPGGRSFRVDMAGLLGFRLRVL